VWKFILIGLRLSVLLEWICFNLFFRRENYEAVEPKDTKGYKFDDMSKN